MLTLYYARNTCAFAAHVVLEDAKATYDTVEIDFQEGEQNSEAYKKVNPKQRVPALVTPHGILTETTAIMLYIAQEHPEMNLIPEDNFSFAIAQSFNAYLASTVHVAHSHKHRGHRWATDDHTLTNLTNKVQENMTACGLFIEEQLLKGPWVLGEKYSICDPYLAVITRWFGDDNVDTSKLPRIMAHNQLIKQRDSMKTVTAIHNP
jgi:glutathione S-transferase